MFICTTNLTCNVRDTLWPWNPCHILGIAVSLISQLTHSKDHGNYGRNVMKLWTWCNLITILRLRGVLNSKNVCHHSVHKCFGQDGLSNEIVHNGCNYWLINKSVTVVLPNAGWYILILTIKYILCCFCYVKCYIKHICQ